MSQHSVSASGSGSLPLTALGLRPSPHTTKRVPSCNRRSLEGQDARSSMHGLSGETVLLLTPRDNPRLFQLLLQTQMNGIYGNPARTPQLHGNKVIVLERQQCQAAAPHTNTASKAGGTSGFTQNTHQPLLSVASAGIHPSLTSNGPSRRRQHQCTDERRKSTEKTRFLVTGVPCNLEILTETLLIEKNLNCSQQLPHSKTSDLKNKVTVKTWRNWDKKRTDWER